MDKNQLQVLARTLVSKYARTQLSNDYQPERIHVYDDAQGNMLYFRIRLKHPKTGDKWIRPFHLDTTKQEFIMKEPHFKDGKPLYHLSAIAKSSTEDIWLFEGEKCVDIAEKLNLLATTSGSATTANDADWTPLKNRNVIIWPDNDKEGIEYSKEVTRKLLALNCHVQQVDIEHLNLSEKSDIVDWLSANPTADIQQVALIDALIEDPSNILYTKASDIKPTPISWLWREHFARGKYSMVVGDPGLGKSQLTAYIAAIVTQAGIWPDKTACEQSGDVVILSAEDDPACTIVPRLMAAGANLKKVNIIEAVKTGCDYRGNPVLKQFDFITDIEELDIMLANNKNVTTVIIDPLSAYLGNTNSHNNSDVRTVQRLPPKNFLKRHIGSIFNGQEQALKLDSVVKNDQLTRQFKSNLVLITKRCLRGYDELGTNDALCPNAKADHKSSILLIEKSKNNARFLSHNERLVCNLVSAFLNNLQPSCCS